MLSSRPSHTIRCAIAGAAAALASAGLARADLTWTPAFNTAGAGTGVADGVNPFVKANWTDSTTGLAYTGTIATGTAVNKNLIINSGYVNFVAASTTPRLALGTGSLSVTGGHLRFVSANNTTDYGYISNGASGSDATGQPLVSISGGQVWVTGVQDVAVTLSGSGVLRLGGSGTSNSVSTAGAADPIAFTASVNITSEDARLEFARKATASVVTDHMGNGEILIDGATPVLGADPAVWEPGDTAVVTTVAAWNWGNTYTTVRKQTAPLGSCVASGACTLTYQSACTGAWTGGGSCAGSCTTAEGCTPVTTSAGCSGTYSFGASCAPSLAQPTDPGFETTDCTTAYGNGTAGFTCSLTAPAFNSQVAGWYDGDDFASRVVVADGTTVPATINGGGNQWGQVGANNNAIHGGGLWTRIGNYDAAHGDYTFALDVGDRLSTSFTSVQLALVAGNFSPMDNCLPGELGATPIGTTGGASSGLGKATAESAITWSNSNSTAARTGSLTVTFNNVPHPVGLVPQTGDALYLIVQNNNSTTAVSLIDNVAVLGACCDTSAACTMTRQGACASPSSWSINGACTPSNPCSTPQGECCVSAACSLTTAAACSASGGVWTVGGSCNPGPCSTASGVCCRGATCSSSVPQSSCTTGTGLAGAAFISSAAACNAAPTANTPCCYADYNKLGGVTVNDIFDFLSDWFAGSPFAATGSSGAPPTLTVQNIFDFLAAWFAGGCN